MTRHGYLASRRSHAGGLAKQGKSRVREGTASIRLGYSRDALAYSRDALPGLPQVSAVKRLGAADGCRSIDQPIIPTVALGGALCVINMFATTTLLDGSTNADHSGLRNLHCATDEHLNANRNTTLVP